MMGHPVQSTGLSIDPLTGDDVERGPGDNPCAPAHPAQPGLPRPARQLRQPHPQEARLDMIIMSRP